MSEAYLYFHDHEREVSFRWDGATHAITVSGGGLTDPRVEVIALQGAPFDDDTVLGLLRWFQSICESHIRMREAADEPIVRPPTHRM